MMEQQGQSCGQVAVIARTIIRGRALRCTHPFRGLVWHHESRYVAYGGSAGADIDCALTPTSWIGLHVKLDTLPHLQAIEV